MKGLDALRPILLLFFRIRGRALLAGIATATVTVLAGIALLGLSGWFITATAIAGLSLTTAVVFDVFAPAAGIRLLAILRTGSRYLERLVTHDATLAILAALREKLFRSWARPMAAETLLKRPARLLFRLTADIDALDSLYLRVLVPAGAAVATALAAGIALGLMNLLFGLLVMSVLVVTGLGIPIAAARRAEKPMRRRAKGTEALRARRRSCCRANRTSDGGAADIRNWRLLAPTRTSRPQTASSIVSRSQQAQVSAWFMPRCLRAVSLLSACWSMLKP